MRNPHSIHLTRAVKAPVPIDLDTLTLHPLLYSILVTSTTIKIFIGPSQESSVASIVETAVLEPALFEVLLRIVL